MALSGALFSWKNGVGTAYISDLPRPVVIGGDKILSVTSHKTGKTVNFFLAHEDKDGSGEDTYGYHFLPIGSDVNVRILIINT